MSIMQDSCSNGLLQTWTRTQAGKHLLSIVAVYYDKFSLFLYVHVQAAACATCCS